MPGFETVNLGQMGELAKLSGKALKLMTIAQKPESFLEALDKAKLASDSVIFLAHGMPEQQAVWWACKSGDKVQDKMAPPDIQAKKAAEAWVRNPTPQNQKAAAETAQKTDFQGPGAWTAQAVAWSKEFSAPVDAELPAEVMNAHKFMAQQQKTGDAVAGAVKLCAALDKGSLVPKPAAPAVAPAPKLPDVKVPALSYEPPPLKPPEPDEKELAQIFDALKPFIDLGRDIANGNVPWK